MIDLDQFVNGYLTCALWSSTDEDENPLDDTYDATAIQGEDRKTIEIECGDFIEAHGNVLRRFGELTHRDAAALGHDLWLTRNRHGVGYWDRYMEADTPSACNVARSLGKLLTDVAVGVGERILTPEGEKVGVYPG